VTVRALGLRALSADWRLLRIRAWDGSAAYMLRSRYPYRRLVVKSSIRGTMNKSEERQFVGVDLHTNRLTAFYIQSNGERYSQNFELSELDEFKKTINNTTHIAVEASCNTFRFCDKIKETTDRIVVINPYKLKLISMVNKKTDRIDAEKLAMFIKSHVLGGEELIEPVFVPDKSIRTLRSLFATYSNIKSQIVQTKNRVHALLKQHMVLVKPSELQSAIGRERLVARCSADPALELQLPILLEYLLMQEEMKRYIEKKIYSAARAYRQQIDLLTSFPGISVLTACALIADIGDISRFPSAKKLASYLRSAPGVDSSNEVTRIKRTSKFGRRLSIGLLIQGVTHFKTAHSELRAWSEGLAQRKKGAGKIRMGIVRKVITQIYQMLKKNEYHYHRNEALHKEKMAGFDKHLARQDSAA
jgi:transposase